MPADPKVSEGARLERRALRAYLRRAIAQAPGGELGTEAQALRIVHAWVRTRQARYDKRAGGLGK